MVVIVTVKNKMAAYSQVPQLPPLEHPSVSRPPRHAHSKEVQLESWPAQPIKQAPSTLSLGQQSPKHPPPAAITAYTSPKPKFLQQLEAYLHKELRLLACPPSGPHELRLQAHREVFEYLIEDFKTYKPLLSAIKTEYELYITHLQQRVGELEPMRSQMEVMRDECERKILSFTEEEKRGEAEVEKENKRLIKVIDTMRARERDYQAQVEKLQTEVGHLYEQYRNETDARKLLVADYNELKLQVGEGKAEEAASEEREDPTVLKLKLARAREDLRAANHRINTMLADYSDVVPRREFEMLETSYKAMESEVETLKSDFGALMEEHKTLQDLHHAITKERDSLSHSLHQMKGTATPRPEWSRCAGYVEEWAEVSEGLSSDQLLDVLLAKVSGQPLKEVAMQSSFQGQGLEEGVPRYLRWEGPVRNRRFNRDKVNQLLSGFWKHRLTSDPGSVQLDSSLYDYLLSINDGSEQAAVEDGYNLQDASSRLTHEPHVALFCRVLAGEEGEEVVQRWMQGQAALTEACAQRQEGGKGLITEQGLQEAVRAVFPGKPPTHVSHLVSQARETASAQPGSIDYIRMLSPDPSGKPSALVRMLLLQQREETRQLVAQLQETLQGQSEVTMAEVENAVLAVDHAHPPSLLAELLTRVFPDPTAPLPLSQVTSHLTATGLTRHSLPL